MCLQFYLAADAPIDPPYDPSVAGLGRIGQVPTAEVKSFRAFTKPYVYWIAHALRCWCRCAHPGTAERRALVALLQWVLRSVPEVELYSCQAGRERLEPNLWDWCMPTELLYLREFQGREFLVIPRDAEPSAVADRGVM